MYTQSLYNIIIDHIDTKKVKHNNKHKKYEYGYNEELDCVVISKDGTIGEIYEIQGLKIAIPKTPEKINGQELKKEDQVFIRRERPESLSKIKTIHDFKHHPEKTVKSG